MTRPGGSAPLGTLSPALLERLLACPLRIAFDQQETPDGPAISSPAALVGIAVHRAVELVVRKKVAEFDEAWEQACDELATEGHDPRMVPTARRARLRLERRLPDLLAFLHARSSVDPLVEETLTSRDGSVKGRLDILVLGDRPAVVDVKTGLVMGDDEVHPGYERQLIIYAWLAATCLGVQVEAALFSLRQGIIPVDASPIAQQRLMAEAMRERDDFNACVPGPQPARPSDEACRWCPYTAACDDLWAALDSGQVERIGPGQAVRGAITSSIVRTRSGVAAVPLDASAGTCTGQAMITDVPDALAGDLQPGDRVAFIGLTLRSGDPLTLAWSPRASRFERLT